MRLEFLPAARSETGRRPKNEDYYTIDEATGLYVVCDGTASRGGGRDAAEIACKSVRETMGQQRHIIDSGDGSAISECLQAAVVSANEAILAKQAEDPALHRMATTLVLAVHRDRELHMINVGDSRIYLYRNGELTQLTRDQNLENYLKDNPHVKPSVQRPGKTLLSALGLKRSQLRIDYLYQTIERDDLLLLCSDGVTDALTPWVMQEILAGAYIDILDDTADSMVRSALSHGGMDNITGILLHAREQKDMNESETVIFEPEAVPGALASGKKFLGWLAFAEGARRGEIFNIDQRITVGASPNCTIVIKGDKYISSHHADVELTDDGFRVRDRESTNGTFINNIRIKTEIVLDGDTVRFGTTPMVFKSCRL